MSIDTDIEGAQPVRLIAHDHQLIFAAPEATDDIGLWSIHLAGESSLVADIDGSGTVDFTDFLVLSSNFGKDVSRGREDGDLNEDGSVTLEDFLILSRDFGRSARVTSGNP